MQTLSLCCVLLVAVVALCPAADAAYYLSDVKTNWFDASEQCRRAGKRLAVINTAAAEQAIEHLTAGRAATSYWVSGTDLGTEGTFFWFTSGQAFNAGYLNWAHGQPNDSNGSQNCVIITHDCNTWYWYDTGCRNLNYFICEDECCPRC